MRGLTIYQPYASLLAHGVKRYETRGWATHYTGAIAIHAGVNKSSIKRLIDAPKIGLTAVKVAAIETICPMSEITKLPMGKILAVGKLVGCFPTDAVKVEKTELSFGDWQFGRWAWQIDNVRLLPVPIEFKGMQGLYGIPSYVRDEIKAQLEGA